LPLMKSFNILTRILPLDIHESKRTRELKGIWAYCKEWDVEILLSESIDDIICEEMEKWIERNLCA